MTSDDADALDNAAGIDGSAEGKSDAGGQVSESSNAPSVPGSGVPQSDVPESPAAEDSDESEVVGEAKQVDDGSDDDLDEGPGSKGGLAAFIAASAAASRADHERDSAREYSSLWGESDDDSGLDAGSGDDNEFGYAEVRRSAPGWAMSKWVVSAVVAAGVIVASFIMIPRLFTPDPAESAAGASTPPPTSAASTSTAPPKVTYPSVVLASAPTHYWKFEMQAAGADSAGPADLEIGSEVAVLGSSAYAGGSGSVDCSGTAKSRILSGHAETPSGDFSIEAWINTVTDQGGPIVTFGNKESATSTKLDRVMYMATNGKIFFGTRDGSRMWAASEDPVNNGTWRHLVGTMSVTTGLTLYVDGAVVATEEDGTSAGEFEGYWKVCGDNPSGWPGNPGRSAFTGTVDDVAIYSTALSAQDVLNHYKAAQAK